ncbi:MAG: GatB/YqeY domain-containing protein, partial [Thermodesulfovibrionales bacterium]|nr:GatB/YqeY domain-containing protein [Thermodesulfovibrionales bacterium]
MCIRDRYERANRSDLAHAEQAELEILLSYMPRQLTTGEIDEIIKSVIKELGAKGPQDMGRVMKAVIPKLKGAADGKLVNQRVKEFLEKGI